jgi:hypothetical protein
VHNLPQDDHPNTDGRHTGGNINESGDPFERACANIFVWICVALSAMPANAQKRWQHHRRPELDILVSMC